MTPLHMHDHLLGYLLHWFMLVHAHKSCRQVTKAVHALAPKHGRAMSSSSVL